jgi:hypothetical protein
LREHEEHVTALTRDDLNDLLAVLFGLRHEIIDGLGWGCPMQRHYRVSTLFVVVCARRRAGAGWVTITHSPSTKTDVMIGSPTHSR